MKEHPAVAQMRQCQQCGACCRYLIVDAEVLDVIREPRIAERGVLLDGHGTLDPEDWTWGLSCGTPCPFQGEDKHCGIYPTRPGLCVACLPGEDQCTMARRSAGLSPIGEPPQPGPPSTVGICVSPGEGPGPRASKECEPP